MKKLSLLLSSEKKRINKLIRDQNNFKKKDGSYVYELEADSTIPSEYIMLMHFLGDIDTKIEKKMVKYLINIQNKEGGWPLFF